MWLQQTITSSNNLFKFVQANHKVLNLNAFHSSCRHVKPSLKIDMEESNSGSKVIFNALDLRNQSSHPGQAHWENLMKYETISNKRFLLGY